MKLILSFINTPALLFLDPRQAPCIVKIERSVGHDGLDSNWSSSLVTSFSSILDKGAKGKHHTVFVPGGKPLTGEKLAKANRQADQREQRTGKRPTVGYGWGRL